jgi:hypothetical protein
MNDSKPMGSTRRKGEFDDALKGYYHDHDEVLPDENVDYKSLNAESVGSLILGFLSVLTFVSSVFLIFPLMGIVLGIRAIRKILRATQELAGLGTASAGVALSAVLAVAGMAYQMYVAHYEVPAGYMEIDFTMLAADPRTGKIPEEIVRLSPHRDERGNERYTPVFIEGYMFPMEQRTAIRSFVLVPSVQQNQFGSPTRNAMQMINVSLLGDRQVSYRTSPVKVGGMLLVNPDVPSGETPYSLKADVFR